MIKESLCIYILNCTYTLLFLLSQTPNLTRTDYKVRKPEVNLMDVDIVDQ